jgi:hypothetical protein
MIILIAGPSRSGTGDDADPIMETFTGSGRQRSRSMRLLICRSSENGLLYPLCRRKDLEQSDARSTRSAADPDRAPSA